MRYSGEILSDVIGAILFALLGYILKTVIVPLVRRFLYRGPSIDGDWDYYDAMPRPGARAGRAHLKQRGTNIEATLTLMRNRKGKQINRVFVLKGTLAGEVVCLFFEQENAQGFIRGACVLRLQTNLTELTGRTTYFEYSENSLISHDFWLEKTV